MKQKQNLLAALVIWMASLGLSVLLFWGGVFENQQKKLSTYLYQERALSDEIVIVGLDEKTRADLGSVNTSHYAEAIKQIQAADPSLVFFDILFSSPSSGIREADLYSIAEEKPNILDFSAEVLSFLADPHPYDLEFAEAVSEYTNIFFIKHPIDDLGWNGQYFEIGAESKPLDLFTQNAHTGFASVGQHEGAEQSGMIFAIPVLYEFNGSVEEHIDVQSAQFHENKIFEIPQENGQMLINFAQKPNGYPQLSFSDAHNGNFDPDFLKGKIVLIGTTATIYQDWHYTPMSSHTPMAGIEIHANAIQTLLDEAFLVHQNLGDFLATCGLFFLLSVFIFMRGPILWSGALLILEFLIFPFYAQWRFDHGVIVNLIWPLVGLLMMYFSVLLYRNFTEFNEKRKLKEAFGRYVSPELVDQIGEHPELLQLGGERRSITALFLDIENFTNLSESLSPQETVKLINTYFDALSKVIMAQGGTVDKYEGDAIMALFGAPISMVDHAIKGCQTALLIREKMAELNASSSYSLNIRIGLSSGDAIVGNMGSENRFDYTAMGDTVNTASRLEGANKFYGTRILVSEESYQRAKEKIFMRRVDTVQLKGKDQALNIYEVLGPIEGASEEGKALIAEWDKALSAYQKGAWDEATAGIQIVMAKLANDGPCNTLLSRITQLKNNPIPNWKGVWKFDEK